MNAAGRPWPVAGSRIRCSPCRLSATGCRLALTIAVAIVSAACGKKGPPLAPIVHVPGQVDQIEARRLGREVYVTVTIPNRNIDASVPADVDRVEVYGHTGLIPPGPRFLEGATLVATIPVAPPLIPSGTGSSPAPPPAGARGDKAEQGIPVTIRDLLDGDELTPRVLAPPPARRGRQPSVTVPDAPPPAGPPQRFYMALAFSDRNRVGPPGTVASLPLTELPDAPRGLQAEYTPDLVRLSWEPSAGLVGFLLDRQLSPELSPVDEAEVPIAPLASPIPPSAPLGPTRYDVYREVAPDPLVLPAGPPAADWEAPQPLPLNPVPLDVLTFDDPLTFDERQRCYLVRAVRGAGPAAVASDPSPRICFTPIDTVPPEAPLNLVAESVQGTINLIWDPNIEEDLAGYLVLRGATGDATLTALIPTPIADTRFADRTAVPGTRYVYAVVAVDSRVPLGNVSAESNRVEEAAR